MNSKEGGDVAKEALKKPVGPRATFLRPLYWSLAANIILALLVTLQMALNTFDRANFINESARLETQASTLASQKTSAENLVGQQEATLKQQQTELDKQKAEFETVKKQLSDANDRLQKQEGQLSKNAKELQDLRKRPPLFSFTNDSAIANRDAEQNAVRDLVSQAYDQLVSVYGNPYLLHQVTISFVDALSQSNASGETDIVNTSQGLAITIRVKHFDQNSFQDVSTIVHEMTHAFHGLAFFTPVAYEEGMAVAVSDLVIERLYNAGQISFSERYLINNDSWLAGVRATVSLPEDATEFYSGDKVAERYQIVGHAFYDLEQNNPGFLKRLNEKAYSRFSNGQHFDYPTLRQFIADSYTGSNRDLLSVRGIVLD